MDMKFKLGDTVRSKVTGFTGIITCYAIYLYGSPRYEVTSKVLNSENKAIAYFLDVEELEGVEIKE